MSNASIFRRHAQLQEQLAQASAPATPVQLYDLPDTTARALLRLEREQLLRRARAQKGGR